MVGLERCGYSLHLIAGDVHIPGGDQLFEDHGERCAVVAADCGAPPLADLGREADAAGEPDLCGIDSDPEHRRGALVGTLPCGQQ